MGTKRNPLLKYPISLMNLMAFFFYTTNAPWYKTDMPHLKRRHRSNSTVEKYLDLRLESGQSNLLWRQRKPSWVPVLLPLFSNCSSRGCRNHPQYVIPEQGAKWWGLHECMSSEMKHLMLSFLSSKRSNVHPLHCLRKDSFFTLLQKATQPQLTKIIFNVFPVWFQHTDLPLQLYVQYKEHSN